MQTREIEINNPIHPGFYESILDIDENQIEYDSQETSLISDLDLSLEYDYGKYQSIVTEEINNYFIELISEVIDDLFDIQDLFIQKIGDELISPKYYNFETDRSFIKIRVNSEKYRQLINLVFNKYYKELDQCIRDNHTSYDGFISFYSNDIKTWIKKYYELDYNELSTVFKCLIQIHSNKGYTESTLSWITESLFEIATETFLDIDSWYESWNDGSKYDYWELMQIENMQPGLTRWMVF